MSHLWPTGSSWVSPSITARYFSSCPSDSTSRWTPCPPKNRKQWLQVRLGCIQLSPSCPFRRLHTVCFLRPARNYPRFWIWRSSFECPRDLNPHEQRAAQRALPCGPTSWMQSRAVANRVALSIGGHRGYVRGYHLLLGMDSGKGNLTRTLGIIRGPVRC